MGNDNEDEDLDLEDDDLEDIESDVHPTKGAKGRFKSARSASRSRSPPSKSNSSSSRFRRTSVAVKGDVDDNLAASGGGAGGGANLWESRAQEVDQSVNLMDQNSDQDVFVGSGRPRGGGGSSRPGMSSTRQKSLVDVFLADDRPQSRGHSGSLFHESRRQKRNKTIRMVVCALFIIIVCVCVIVAVPSFGLVHNMTQKNPSSNNNNKPKETPKPTPAPTPAPKEDEKEVLPEEQVQLPENARPQAAGASLSGGQADLELENVPQSSRFDALKFYIQDQDVSDQSEMEKAGSPTQKAMQWASQEDPAQLEIPGLDATKDSSQAAEHALLQRYALAVFYFSMEAASSSNQEGNAGRRHLGLRNLQVAPPPTEGELANRQAFDNDWLSAKNVCEWHGVTCTQHTKSVKEINLASHLLQGTVPREILDGGAMPYLTKLDLDNNQLQGKLPKLDIERQTAGMESGAPPSKPALEKLMLSRNQLTGYLDNLMAMKDLKVINLAGNRFEGPIPNEIMDLSGLEELTLNSNRLSGNLPGESLGELTMLRILEVASNTFNEQLPEMLYTMTNLQTLDVSENQLTGYIPDDIGELTNLVELALDKNQFTGEIPATFHKLKKLRRLLMDGNKLTGIVSPEVCGLRNTTLKEFEADCGSGGDLTCSCCTHCF